MKTKANLSWSLLFACLLVTPSARGQEPLKAAAADLCASPRFDEILAAIECKRKACPDPDGAEEASMRGALVVRQAAENHGLPADSLRASVDGRRARGEVLTVHVATDVPILRIPFLGAIWPSLAVPVEAKHAVQIDRYRSAP